MTSDLNVLLSTSVGFRFSVYACVRLSCVCVPERERTQMHVDTCERVKLHFKYANNIYPSLPFLVHATIHIYACYFCLNIMVKQKIAVLKK